MYLVDMLTTMQDPAFQREVVTAINEFCPKVQELTYIEHGADNIIALVNKEFVFRFPRHENAAKRLAYETALLQKISGHITAVAIPEVLKVNTMPLNIVAKYIPGDHLTGRQIQQLSEEDQIAIGRKIAEFIAQLNQAVSGLEIRRIRAEAAVDSLEEPWPVYFNRLFVTSALPNDRLRPIVNQYYGQWKNNVQSEQAVSAIHDDLHPSNLLFFGNKLTGIVDFGDTNTGSIESELRWLYLMGDTVLQSAISHYQELTGNSVNYEHVRVWAIMHELSSFTSGLMSQKTETFPFKRSQENLRQWIPEFPL